MKYANHMPITSDKPSRRSRGALTALPGTYSATLFKREGASITQLAEPVEFVLQSIYKGALKGASAEARAEYDNAVNAAQKRAITATTVLKEMKATMTALRNAIDRTPGNVAELELQFASIQDEINVVNRALFGLASRDRKGAKPANITSRLGYARSGVGSSYGPTQQHHDQLRFASEGLNEVSNRISALQQRSVPALQQAVVNEGGPWTLGLPVITQ